MCWKGGVVLEGGDVGKGGGSRLCVWGGGGGGASNEGAGGGLKKWVDPLQVRMGGGGKEGACGRGGSWRRGGWTHCRVSRRGGVSRNARCMMVELIHLLGDGQMSEVLVQSCSASNNNKAHRYSQA